MKPLVPAVALAVVLQAAAAQAQTYQGARPIALGEAYRATASGNEAMYYNAAGMSLFLQRYNVDVGWSYNPEGGLHYFNGSILDTLTSPPLGAAFGFTYFMGDQIVPDRKTVPDYRKIQGYRLDLGISYPLARQLLWGFDLKFIDLDVDARESAIYSVTGDMGIIWIMSKYVRGAVVAHNMVPIGRRDMPVQSAASVAIGREASFQGITDVVVNYLSTDDVKVQASAGLEMMAGEILALRAGYMYDQIPDAHYVSGGIGLVAPRVGLDFAYRQNLTFTDDRWFALVLKLFAG
ncbi:MAG: hypothetical protein HY897_11585 [Deltaproteobacteria bacterium]|nr:hypothetical protein [Deltaproteobacteria bacterium]